MDKNGIYVVSDPGNPHCKRLCGGKTRGWPCKGRIKVRRKTGGDLKKTAFCTSCRTEWKITTLIPGFHDPRAKQ